MATVHPALTVEWLRENPPCRFFRLSKAKRGPNLRWACSFCTRVLKKRECASPNQSKGMTPEREG